MALRYHGGPLAIEVKSDEPTDVVTVADREAEAAAVAAIVAERPDDAVSGEEGTDRAGTSGRRWVIDAIDGTLNFSLGLSSWCAAVVLIDADGPLASAVFDPERDELFSAARGEGAHAERRQPGTSMSHNLVVLDGVPLDRAAIACHWGFGRIAYPGARERTHRIVDAVGALRIPGSGTLELAWVAAGRLHGWLQADALEWDWLPGALLVREAGGVAEERPGGPIPWMLAGSAEMVDDLAALL